jgi:hypothetical protein
MVASKTDNSPHCCAICNKLILNQAELRTISHANRQFHAHGQCLLQLRQLALKAYSNPPPLPTLLRPMTLSEFLLSKRPKDDVEILTCLAYYLEKHTHPPQLLNSQTIEKLLHFTGFKIKNKEAALRKATQEFAFLKLCSTNTGESYKLTKKGVQRVKHLPN